MEKELPKRKNLRLKYFDYSTQGSYFLTLCTHNRKNILSHIVGAIHESPAIKLTECGSIAECVINNIPSHYGAFVEKYVIMPNHIHLIVEILDDDLRAIRESPLQRSVISKIVGYIKMNVSKEIRKRYGFVEVWQRGYYDHVIRDIKDYEKISEYIEENPYNWQNDSLYVE